MSCGAPTVEIDLEVDGRQAVVEMFEVVEHLAPVCFEEGVAAIERLVTW
jgi:hypothetical protein